MCGVADGISGYVFHSGVDGSVNDNCWSLCAQLGTKTLTPLLLYNNNIVDFTAFTFNFLL